MAMEKCIWFTLIMFTSAVYSTAQSAVPQDASSNDIDACMFSSWTSGPAPILASTPKCSGKDLFQLCYGLPGGQTKIAICYNSTKLTPEFTGHIVEKTTGAGRNFKFAEDKGSFRPRPQALVPDYSVAQQLKDFPTFNEKQQEFCAKGHLAPNGDFGPDKDRALTFILTNIAPQWQLFNGGNWAALETGLHNYITSQPAGRKVYVFTGVGGEAKDGSGKTYKMNGKVVAPKFYWKAICDPTIKQSVVYVGENPVGINSNLMRKGCNGKDQTIKLGVMECMSLEFAIKSYHAYFKLPMFLDSTCDINNQGSFLDRYVTFR